jgi:hypothetical protein
MMRVPLTSQRIESEAQSHLMGDLYGYEPEIRRAARNTLVVLAVMAAAVAATAAQSCATAGLQPVAIAH